MGRKLSPSVASGQVKSIQHISQSFSATGGTSTKTISSVDTTKSIIVANPEHSNFFGEHYADGRTYGNAGSANASFTNATTVSLSQQNLDQHPGPTYGSRGSTWYGTVVEYS